SALHTYFPTNSKTLVPGSCPIRHKKNLYRMASQTSFMNILQMLSLRSVLRRSKNFTSNVAIRMPPPVSIIITSVKVPAPPRTLNEEHRDRIESAPAQRPESRQLDTPPAGTSRIAVVIPITGPRMSPVSLSFVTTSPSREWVICAPAAFLGCGSRFSGSLSESNPDSPLPVTTMRRRTYHRQLIRQTFERCVAGTKAVRSAPKLFRVTKVDDGRNHRLV
ncbi:hypothetical protein PGT21_000609, partial [Puccinia graminis f. sp. tritici]